MQRKIKKFYERIKKTEEIFPEERITMNAHTENEQEVLRNEETIHTKEENKPHAKRKKKEDIRQKKEDRHRRKQTDELRTKHEAIRHKKHERITKNMIYNL